MREMLTATCPVCGEKKLSWCAWSEGPYSGYVEEYTTCLHCDYKDHMSYGVHVVEAQGFLVEWLDTARPENLWTQLNVLEAEARRVYLAKANSKNNGTEEENENDN